MSVLIIIAVVGTAVLLYVHIRSDSSYEKTRKGRWLALTFSGRGVAVPEADEQHNGYGGLRHNQWRYLNTLPKIARVLGRKAILPPPWISLSMGHNSDRRISNLATWGDYFDVSRFENVDDSPPVSYASNGRVRSPRSVKYYPAHANLDSIDPNVEVAVLVNFDDANSDLKSYSDLSPGMSATQKRHYKQLPDIEFTISPRISGLVNELVNDLALSPFTFIHIRRGDVLDEKDYAPPSGTRQCTSPKYVAEFIRDKTPNSSQIIIAYKEDKKDEGYVDNLRKLLPNQRLVFERELRDYLPKSVLEDDFQMYQVLDGLASRSETNVATSSFKLGKGQLKLCNAS